ncbi:uncharacterized protein LOC144375741 [Ictidomys tridecemlineatus]
MSGLSSKGSVQNILFPEKRRCGGASIYSATIFRPESQNHLGVTQRLSRREGREATTAASTCPSASPSLSRSPAPFSPRVACPHPPPAARSRRGSRPPAVRSLRSKVAALRGREAVAATAAARTRRSRVPPLGRAPWRGAPGGELAGVGPAELRPLLRSLRSRRQALSEVLTEQAGSTTGSALPPWEASPAPIRPLFRPAPPSSAARAGRRVERSGTSKGRSRLAANPMLHITKFRSLQARKKLEDRPEEKPMKGGGENLEKSRMTPVRIAPFIQNGGGRERRQLARDMTCLST